MKAKILIAILLLIISACKTTQIKQGIVRNKNHYAERNMIYPILIPMYCGKDCTMYQTILIPYHEPEAFTIVIDGKDQDGKNSQVELYTSKEKFECFNLGDNYYCGDEGGEKCIVERPRYETERR